MNTTTEPKSTLKFYRIPQAAVELGCVGAWKVIEDDPASVSLRDVLASPMRPQQHCAQVMEWLEGESVEAAEFQAMIASYKSEGANIFFVSGMNGIPLMGWAI